MKKILAFLSLTAVMACNSETKTEVDTTSKELSLTKLWSSDTTSMITPEGLIYDPNNDVVYVSCINGVPPSAKDGDGYIAVMNTDGSIKNAKWITGLDAPKGMGLCQGYLYVTDITRLLKIDLSNGEIVSTYEVDGASFLNDVAVDPDHVVYFTDSDTGIIYQLADETVSVFKENDKDSRPNGLLVDDESIFLANSATNTFEKINLKSKESIPIADGIGAGDGIAKLGDTYIVSDWNGEIFAIKSTGEKTSLLNTKDQKLNTADITIINGTNTLLVPEFFGNKVSAYSID